MHLRTAFAALAALSACSVELRDGQFRCVDKEPGTCPPSWTCLRKGATGDFRCYREASGFCGNGELDPGEECDGRAMRPLARCSTSFPLCDPNTCRIYCTACGNGRVELPSGGRGEECDDGNLRSHDGCSSRCRVEPRAWRRWRPEELGPRGFDGGAYDLRRNRVVISGGGAGSWEFDGALWTRRKASALDASKSKRHLLAYHWKLGRMVLIDGEAEWHDIDGVWKRQRDFKPAGTLEAWNRALHAITYDARRERIVLAAGAPLSRLSTIWEHDGAGWRKKTIVGAVPSLPVADTAAGDYAGHAMAYFWRRGRVYLVTPGTKLLEVWEYDGVRFTRLTTKLAPATRTGHSLALDPFQNCLVLFGGQFVGQPLKDSWRFCRDGEWTKDREWAGGAVPTARWGQTSVANMVGRSIVTVGGLLSAQQRSAETWIYRAQSFQNWDGRAFAAPAADVRNLRVTYRASEQSILLLQHAATGSWRRATLTWERLGDRWVPRADVPVPLREHAVAYDSRRHVVVAAPSGGAQATAERDRTPWRTGASSWRAGPLSPAGFPDRGGAMAYDAAAGRMVLFGGAVGDGASTKVVDDTWTYDGKRWQRLTVATRPAARQDAAIAFDPTRGQGTDRGRVVLFGGRDQKGAWLADTWELRGTGAWTKVSPSGSPPAGVAAMTYDPLRLRVAMVTAPATSAKRASTEMRTWELDGDAWTEVGGGRYLSTLTPGSIAFDSARRAVVRVSSGSDVDGAELWELRTDNTSIAEVCSGARDADGDGLKGCDDPDCNLDAACASKPRESCVNGIDDDGDTLVDCADPNCGAFPCGSFGKRCFGGRCACPAGVTELSCSDGIDNDCDGKIDAADADCGHTRGDGG